jgi:hypothetical protein
MFLKTIFGLTTSRSILDKSLSSKKFLYGGEKTTIRYVVMVRVKMRDFKLEGI